VDLNRRSGPFTSPRFGLEPTKITHILHRIYAWSPRALNLTAGQSRLEPPVGVEPTTPALQERCSGQLS
jgi:hypothetical protein